MKKSIFYLGKECFFLQEVDSINVAQHLLDFWKAKGYMACATHKNNKHQIYVSE